MELFTRAKTARCARLGSILVLFVLVCQAGCVVERPIRYRVISHRSVSDPQFSRVMGSLLGPALIGGNSTRTLLNGDEIFPAMLDAIHSARKTITFETYIYWKGDIGKQFTDAFVDRAHAGVSVNVLIDAVGSEKMDRSYIRRMKDAGVSVNEYHAFHIYDPSSYPQIDHRTHRKLMMVDGTVGFTGGDGNPDEWRGDGTRPGNWLHKHYLIRGPV